MSVEGPVRVRRGGSVDLRAVLEFRPQLLPPATECKVTNIARPGTNCGSVSPNIFNCRQYSGAILYQHYGCFANLEIATFMLSFLPSSNSSAAETYGEDSSSLQPTPQHVSLFSVEVHVKGVHPLFQDLRVETVQAHAFTNGSAVLNLTIVFPVSMVGTHYEILSGWKQLQLPMAGLLKGTINQPLPSGYIPTSSLTYHTHSPIFMDYILLKSYVHKTHQQPFQIAYGIFGFRASGNAENISSSFGVASEAIFLEPSVRMVVRQAVNAPVTISNLTLLDFIENSTIFGGNSPYQTEEAKPLLRYIFPILSTGAFLSLHSTATNVSYSVFSSRELCAGEISFHPNDNHLSSTDTSIYHYNITTATGHLIARGEVSVMAKEREVSYPAQRRNIPLKIAEGGWASINVRTIDFYLLKLDHNTTMIRALRHPSHGYLEYQNGSHVDGAQLLFLALEGSTFRYQHSGDESLCDIIIWEVYNHTGDALQVVMSILVAPMDDTHPTLDVGSTKVHVYRDWAVPISSSSFQPADGDSPLENIHIQVVTLQGLLLRVHRNMTHQSELCNFLPFVSSSLWSCSQEEVRSFSLWELEQQTIWYVPTNTLSVEMMTVTVNDSINVGPEIYNLYMAVLTQQPNLSLVLSTTRLYPYIVKNIPLPLYDQEKMFLTPYFLFSQAPPTSSQNVKYIVQNSPRQGHLCAVHNVPCISSLRSFTQQDISYHHIVYQPNSETLHLPDNFTFELTVQGFHPSNVIIYAFHFTASPPETVVSDTPLVLSVGSEALFTTQNFQVFSSFLHNKNLTFYILQPPHFGNLILIHSTDNRTGLQSQKLSSFTYDDLVDHLLFYNSTQHMSFGLCTDQILFDVVSPNRTLHGRLPIALGNGGKALSVATQPHTLIGLTRFCLSTDHISVSSSFCAEWVMFVVMTMPSRGYLSVKNHLLKTESLLSSGSRFSARDIQSGLVCYSRFSSLPIQSNTSDSFSFTTMDPSYTDGKGDTVIMNNFTVLLMPPPSSRDYTLELNLSSRHPITWLPVHQMYGYAIPPSDITHLDTTLPQHAILLQLEKPPIWGNMVLNQLLTSSFTVADVLGGRIAYLKNEVVRNGTYRESLKLGVYAYLPNLLWLAGIHYYELEWAVLGFAQRSITVSENQGTVQLTIR